MKQDDYRKHGLIGTIVFHVVLLLLMMMFGLMPSVQQPEEGLLVNFGDSETGMGMEEPGGSKVEPVVEPVPTPPVKSSPPKSPKVKAAAADDAVNTQDFEEAAALKEAKKKKQEAVRKENEAKQEADAEAKRIRDEAKKLKDEADKAQKAAEEAERKKQAELARQAAAAQSAVKNAFGSGRGTGTGTGAGTGAGSSEGVTGGAGNQGQLTGDPNSKNRQGSGLGTKGNGFSLSGRSLVGTLPKPEYNIQEDGIVVVEITVDRDGRVINAAPILRGTTTQNSYLWRVAKEAALKAKFNADTKATVNQKGTITYHFSMQ